MYPQAWDRNGIRENNPVSARLPADKKLSSRPRASSANSRITGGAVSSDLLLNSQGVGITAACDALSVTAGDASGVTVFCCREADNAFSPAIRCVIHVSMTRLARQ